MKKPDECETCEDRKAGNCEKWAKDPARTIPDMSADIETVRQICMTAMYMSEWDTKPSGAEGEEALKRIEQALKVGSHAMRETEGN